MALARFFDRVADAVLPLFVDGVRRNFAERLSQTAITLRTGASINGRLLVQTAVNLDSSTVTQPAP